MIEASGVILERARQIRALALDVDGVLTDGELVYGPAGELVKRFSARDGFGIKLAQMEGISVAILSGRVAPPLAARLDDLGIQPDHVIQGSRDKGRGIERLAARLRLALSELAFIGDDVPDLPALVRVGLAACPVDAVREVKEVCHFVTTAKGGRGAVRDLVELVLRARGRWDLLVEDWTAGKIPDGFETPSSDQV